MIKNEFMPMNNCVSSSLFILWFFKRVTDHGAVFTPIRTYPPMTVRELAAVVK